MSKASANRQVIPAVAYLRRSTEKQEASIPDQRSAVKQYAAKHGYKLIREYVDDAISGDDTEKRLDFQRMIGDCAGKARLRRHPLLGPRPFRQVRQPGSGLLDLSASAGGRDAGIGERRAG